ncbi:MAG TPA: hypothetical protein VGM31_14320 [Puia sp.]|jgi:hypothetical protein
MKREKFGKLMIDVTDLEGQIKAYKKVYPTCKKKAAAIASSYKLLENAEVKAIIDAGKREKEDTIREAVKAERIKKAQEMVAHEFELDAQMSNIAMGRHRRKKKTPIFNPAEKKFQIVEVDEEPTETDMIQAADKLYKRKGSYAATTVKHEGGDTFINFFAQLATVHNNNIPNAITPGSESKV